MYYANNIKGFGASQPAMSDRDVYFYTHYNDAIKAAQDVGIETNYDGRSTSLSRNQLMRVYEDTADDRAEAKRIQELQAHQAWANTHVYAAIAEGAKAMLDKIRAGFKELYDGIRAGYYELYHPGAAAAKAAADEERVLDFFSQALSSSGLYFFKGTISEFNALTAFSPSSDNTTTTTNPVTSKHKAPAPMDGNHPETKEITRPTYVDYPATPSFKHEDFKMFFALDIKNQEVVQLMKYPSFETENNIPLFFFIMRFINGHTVFEMTDNSGEVFIIPIPSILFGKTTLLFEVKSNVVILNVWGGGVETTRIEKTKKSRNVSFEHRKLIGA